MSRNENVPVAPALNAQNNRRPIPSVPNMILKAIFVTQSLLIAFGAQSSAMVSAHIGTTPSPPFANFMLLLPPAFLYMNMFILFFGLYGILHRESSESVFMYFCCNIGAIIPEIIILGVYNGRFYGPVVNEGLYGYASSDYKFSLGVTILNLLLRPIAALLLHRVYQDRLGITAFVLPGLSGNSDQGPRNNYENLSGTTSGIESVSVDYPASESSVSSSYQPIDDDDALVQ